MKTVIPLFAVLVFLTACANLETNAYKVIGSTVVTVDAAMNGWGDYVRAGLASDEDQGRVKFAYAQYQASIATIRIAVNTYRTSKDKTALDAALDVLDATKNTLIDQIMKARGQKP